MPQSFSINISKFNIALFLRAILLLSPVMLLFYQENGLSVMDLFFFQGIFYITSIASEAPIGYLSNNISRKNLLIISFFIFIAFYLLWLFFSGYYIILIGEIMFAISKVMMDNAMSGYLYDYLTYNKKQEMPKYYGYLNFYLALGTAIAGLIGAFMYSNFGSKPIIVSEILLVLCSIILILTLPSIKPIHKEEKIKNYIDAIKELYQNDAIRYYIFYSGLLTSFSILFALSFQPLMQNALFPIALFGVIAFTNHAFRAFAGVIAGKWLHNLEAKKLVVPLFILYIFAFITVLNILQFTNIPIILGLLIFICAVIGVQLIFTILHISRIHKLTSFEKRGTLMAINNFISRILTAIILFSSKFFIDKLGINFFFALAFLLFLVSCSYFMVRIIKLKEQA